MNGKWTQEEIDYLNHAYRNKIKQKDIANYLGRSIGSVKSQIIKQKLPLNNSVYKNSSTYKAIYQNYDWCYQKYIVEGLDMKEMAMLANTTLRTIQKWCSEVYHLNLFTYKEHKKLNAFQYQIILSGSLGDGCIFKKDNTYLYIESHSITEKDYMFWKYEHLKDCCTSAPKYREGEKKKFGDKEYNVKASYRMTTRCINDLQRIYGLSKKDRIDKLDKLGLCLLLLDDGSYDSIWELCLAELKKDEIDYFIKICKDKFGLVVHIKKDTRYVSFNADSSRRMISWMLEYLPNDMDILHKKFLDKHIPQKPNYIRVIINGKRLGLAQWCRNNNYFKLYPKIRDVLRKDDINEIDEQNLLLICKRGSF